MNANWYYRYNLTMLTKNGYSENLGNYPKEMIIKIHLYNFWGAVDGGCFPCSSTGKESACNVGDLGSIPGLGGSPGEGNSNPFHYSCLRNLWTEEPGGLQSTGSPRVN